MKKLSLLCVALLVVAGCSSPITKKDKQDLAAQVDCSTAEGDIRVLNSEKVNLAKEIADGATSIIPIGLVTHLLMRDEGDTLKVGTGEYNRALDKKIAQIKTQCGIK